jgi:hypothetical protein
MIDSGASRSITFNKEDFYDYTEYKPVDKPYAYYNANSVRNACIGYGTVPILIRTRTNQVKTILTPAFHDLNANMLGLTLSGVAPPCR